MARAARLHAWNAAPVVEDVPEPVAEEGESLVEMTAAAVAHIDLTVAGGTFAFRPPLPYIPGTEGAGRIVRSGRFPVGAPVRLRGAGVGLRRDGTWAELAAVPDGALTPVPEDVDLTLAAAFFSPCVTAHAALHEIGDLQAGERVAVTGAAGAVGAMTVQLALAAGASEVIGLEPTDERAALVPAGARAVAGAGDVRDVDLLVDMAGGPGLPDLVTGAVRPGGRAVLVGYAAGTRATFELPALLAADVRLLPMNLIRWSPRLGDVAGVLLRRVASGELTLPLTLLPLEDAAEALAQVREGRARGRIALTVERRVRQRSVGDRRRKLDQRS